MAEPPGAVATTYRELVEILRTGGVRIARPRPRGRTFRERFCYLDDGGAAERVVRRVLLGT